MSSSSATTTNSRSPSPESSDSPCPIDTVAVQAELDAVHSWFIPMQPKYSQGLCETDFSILTQPRKLEDEQMLCLDDILEQHAFDDGVPAAHLTQTTMNVSSPKQQPAATDIISVNPRTQIVPNFRPGNLLIPSQNGPISVTKPIPPPASLPRKLDASNHNRVVHPPKESCFNLPIVFPSIPEGGTKSRVETQVRVTVDLADSCTPSDPLKYDRVGSWKWLKLPPGTSTKRRTRKQGKIEADPQDTLTLFVEVVCASAPNKAVAKRVAKKIAARVRPTRSDSESAAEDASGKAIKKSGHEDTNSIIQFNCAEILDFSAGSVVLPLRITCYCRHHREKVGFLVRFTMMDHINRIVGTGTSKPIMITDDHKTASANSRHNDYVNSYSGIDHDWPHLSTIPAINSSHSSPSDLHGPSRRKDKIAAKKRPKPYDTFAKLSRSAGSREGSVSSVPSPSTSYSPLPLTRSPTPSSVLQNLLAASEAISHSQADQVQAPIQTQQLTQMQTQPQTPNIPALQPSIHGSDSSSPDSLSTPLDSSADVQIPELFSAGEASIVPDSFQSLPQLQQPIQAPFIEQPQPMSLMQHIPPQLTQPTLLPQSASTLPFLFFDSNQSAQSTLPCQLPTIHRLIPNMGPTFGGIEVTILGANFHPRMSLRCVFGETVASSTQRWSDNTLVCVLPPREQPGVVEVWFEGFPKVGEQRFSLGVGGGSGSQVPSLFTYSDESDRALMELALQVVGLKMTGKLEDAKNVAMRIVGNAGSDSSTSHNDSSNNMQLASLPSTTAESTRVLSRGLRSRLLVRPGETDNFESTVLSFLSILDAPLDDTSTPHALRTSQAISHSTATGQTLLHLAAFMGFSSLVTFLVEHEADLDARDDNGFTSLHFASLAGREECIKVLVKAGADREIVDTKGRTAAEVGKPDFLKGILVEIGDQTGVGAGLDGSDSETEDEDEEAGWGDAEDDVDTKNDAARIRNWLKRRTSRKALMGAPTSGRGTPKQSMEVLRVPTPVLADNIKAGKDDVSASQRDSKDEKNAETKQTAWFNEMISRTLAQLPPAAGIVPNIPHLAKPQLPGLPDFSGVPWGYLPLPQFPMVFPVLVPPYMWPSFLGGGPGAENEKHKENDGQEGKNTSGTVKAMQEWRTTWEKWVAFAITMTAKQQQEQGQTQVRTEQAEEDVPPPEYTPRQDEVTATITALSPSSSKAKGKGKVSHPATPSREADVKILNETPVVTAPSASSSRTHPVGYDGVHIPEEEIEAYVYQPPLKQKQKHKKHDRMLLLFWLPILLLSLMWAFHTGIRFAYQTLRTTIPAKLQRT